MFGGTLLAALCLYKCTVSAAQVPPQWYEAHRFWAYWNGFFFDRPLFTGAFFAAITVAICAYLVCRYLGWRIGIMVAIVLMFMPWFWNGATRGDYRMVHIGWIAVGIWILNEIAHKVFKRTRDAKQNMNITTTGSAAVHFKIPYLKYAGHAAIAIAVLFAIVSCTYHEFRYGQARRIFEADAAAENPLSLSERWERVKPLLDVKGDPFIPQMRRKFAIEGNAEGNRLQDAGKSESAWTIYKWIMSEVEPGNFSAIVNLSEMMRLGYEPSKSDALKVRKALDDFFRDKRRALHAAAIAAASGPVHADVQMLAQIRENALKRLEEMRLNHEPITLTPEIKTLVSWSAEMTEAMDDGNLGRAGKIARTILQNPDWDGFIPANAVLGTVSAVEGDLEASERYFRKATSGTNAVNAVICNDFAESLRLAGKLEEAEQWARKAVGGSTPQYWVSRLTLIDILLDGEKCLDEVKALLDEASQIQARSSATYIRDARKRYYRILGAKR